MFGEQARGEVHERTRRGLAFLPDERGVIRALTVEQNLRVAGVSSHDAYQISPELEALNNRKAGDLSGGEQQILALTRAIASRPRLLLVDEISFGLAPIVVTRMFDLIKRVAEQGAAILLVEQYARHALEISQRAYVLQRGTIALHGPSIRTAGEHRVHRAVISGSGPCSSTLERQTPNPVADRELVRALKVSSPPLPSPRRRVTSPRTACSLPPGRPAAQRHVHRTEVTFDDGTMVTGVVEPRSGESVEVGCLGVVLTACSDDDDSDARTMNRTMPSARSGPDLDVVSCARPWRMRMISEQAAAFHVAMTKLRDEMAGVDQQQTQEERRAALAGNGCRRDRTQRGDVGGRRRRRGVGYVDHP